MALTPILNNRLQLDYLGALANGIMMTQLRCPNCGKNARMTSESNPVRNTIRETVKCNHCGYVGVREKAPNVTLGDWVKVAD